MKYYPVKICPPFVKNVELLWMDATYLNMATCAFIQANCCLWYRMTDQLTLLLTSLMFAGLRSAKDGVLLLNWYCIAYELLKDTLLSYLCLKKSRTVTN